MHHRPFIKIIVIAQDNVHLNLLKRLGEKNSFTIDITLYIEHNIVYLETN